MANYFTKINKRSTIYSFCFFIIRMGTWDFIKLTIEFITISNI